jgi:hypothetical protein
VAELNRRDPADSVSFPHTFPKEISHVRVSDLGRHGPRVSVRRGLSGLRRLRVLRLLRHRVVPVRRLRLLVLLGALLRVGHVAP